MKEAALAAVLISELNLFQIFGPRKDIVLLCVQSEANFFLEMGLAYMTMSWELQARAYALVLSNLQFSF